MKQYLLKEKSKSFYFASLFLPTNNLNNFDLGFPSKINFEEGVMKYAYNWREGGQFSVKDFKKG